jgi:hypothetical protein
MVPIEHRRGRPIIRSMMCLYRVNIVVRGTKKERENIRELSYRLRTIVGLCTLYGLILLTL